MAYGGGFEARNRQRRELWGCGSTADTHQNIVLLSLGKNAQKIWANGGEGFWPTPRPSAMIILTNSMKKFRICSRKKTMVAINISCDSVKQVLGILGYFVFSFHCYSANLLVLENLSAPIPFSSGIWLADIFTYVIMKLPQLKYTIILSFCSILPLKYAALIHSICG